MQRHRQTRTHALIAIVAIAAALAVLMGARRAAAEGPHGADAGAVPGMIAPADRDTPQMNEPNPRGNDGEHFGEGVGIPPEDAPVTLGSPIDGVPVVAPEGSPDAVDDDDSGGLVPEDQGSG